MSHGDWNDFYLVDDELKRWTDADVDAAEAALGVRLPPGYRELMTTLGDGVISNQLRVRAPGALETEQELFRRIVREAWFFDELDETLTQDYALECFMIADSLQGDKAIFHPVARQLHVLPRDLERTYAVGTTLRDVVAWFLDSGVPYRPRPFRWFEPSAGPPEAVIGRGDGADFDHLVDAMRSLGLHDVEEDGAYERAFFVKAIGGYISFRPESADVHVHVRLRQDRGPDVRARIRDAAEAAGVSFSKPWLMAPSGG